MKKILMLVPFLFLLNGCEERYRYPCQNPENWKESFCKKPICSANGTCPEDLTPYEKEKVASSPSRVTTQSIQPSQCGAIKKGECK